MKKETQVRCPVEGCEKMLAHHDVVGLPSADDPLKIDITRNVYECADHGLLAYLGFRKFARLSN